MNNNFWKFVGVAVLMMAFVLAGKKTVKKDPNTLEIVNVIDQARLKAEKDSIARVKAAELEMLQKHTHTAKFIAGLDVPKGGLYTDSLKRTAGWASHKRISDEMWNKMEKTHFMKMREWGSKELKEVRSLSDTIFYPFSGPDFLFANTLLPQAHSYYLAGLEPVGEIPDISKIDENNLKNDLLGLRVSLDDILNLSFFKTNDMKVDFKRTKLKGIIPLLYVFFARTGHQILSAEYLFLNEKGDFEKRNAAKIKEGNKIPCVKIVFRREGSNEYRELFYFSVNLHDSNFELIPQFSELVKSMGNPITYLKGASYLMYKDYFSGMRSLILDNSIAVLGDDSGIPYRFYPSTQWDQKLWGEYYMPIPLFANWYQQSLRTAYENKDGGIKQLPFGIGYNYTKSHLMLFHSKKHATKAKTEKQE